jgi:hypothetical protein
MRAVALGVALMVSGCSFLLVNGPPSPPPTQGPVHCDSSAVRPNLLDLAAGTVLGLGTFAIYYGAAIDESRPSSEQKTPVLPALFGIAAAAPFYASAYIGYRRTRRCRDVKRALPR